MVSVSVARGKLQRLFATPVITDEPDFGDRFNADLEAAILAERSRSAGYQMSNRGGWQSEHNLSAWAGAAATRLIDHALMLADAHTEGPMSGRGRWRCESWANVNGDGDFSMPHVHSGTFWSVVYYVSIGEGTAGELVLYDPRMPALDMHAPHLAIKGVGPQGEWRIDPKPGLMVLFPAWLSHGVEPWRGTGQRISVAMNIRARTMLHPSHEEKQAKQ